MNRKSFLILFFVILSLGTASCAPKATTYRPLDRFGGYTDAQLSQNTVKVSFVGNTLITKHKVEVYSLYRCAEITIEKGFDYFVVESSNSELETQSVGGGGCMLDPLRPPVRTFSKPRAYNTITMYKGKKPEDNRDAYDARELMRYMQLEIIR